VTDAGTETADPSPSADAAPAPVGPPASTFSVFRKRDFRLLWSAQLVSTIGTALTDLAAGILVFRETHSAAAVGLMFVATAVPTLIVGLIAGVFVDRYDRRKIMVIADLLRAVIVVSIPFLIHINIGNHRGVSVVTFIQNAGHTSAARDAGPARARARARLAAFAWLRRAKR